MVKSASAEQLKTLLTKLSALITKRDQYTEEFKKEAKSHDITPVLCANVKKMSKEAVRYVHTHTFCAHTHTSSSCINTQHTHTHTRDCCVFFVCVEDWMLI